MATTGLSPSERSLRARQAAHTLHSRYDSRELTEKARAAYLKRFARQVDPDGLLPEQERQRRPQHALQAHMSSLAYKSARAKEVLLTRDGRGTPATNTSTPASTTTGRPSPWSIIMARPRPRPNLPNLFIGEPCSEQGENSPTLGPKSRRCIASADGISGGKGNAEPAPRPEPPQQRIGR
jgi:hypothetical protein